MVKQEDEAFVLVTDNAETQTSRQREPEHFVLKVESFSKSKLEKYESDEFEAGGYRWRLILYPNGDKERNGSNHISLYLSISDTEKLSSGWEVEADFSLFIYNSLSRNYQTYKLADKTRFNWLKTESGFAQLIPLDEFKETSNGYLFGDACVFGAEVYVTGYTAIPKRQILLMTNDNVTNPNIDTKIITWTVGSFSTLNHFHIQSENFIAKDVKWHLRLFPKGDSVARDVYISAYLSVTCDEVAKRKENREKVNAEYNLRIRNQVNNNHVTYRATHIFCNDLQGWGFRNFMLLSDLNDESKGFLKNDSLVLEVEFTKLEIVKESLAL